LKDGHVLVYFYLPHSNCGSVPFYRLYHGAKKDHFYTISEAERLDFTAN
jgi:hypothetical protein